MSRALEPAQPLVSVVIPTFDRARLVPEAVDSVCAQTLSDLEVLVVDDGSTDGTADRLRARYAHDPRVRVLRTRRGGTACARNAGLAAARGAFLAFLDSDDAWLPGFLAAQHAALQAAAWAGLAICDARYEGGRGRRGPTMQADPDFRAPLTVDALFADAWALPCTWLWRREALAGLRFDATYRRCDDTELLLRYVARGGRVVLRPAVLARYRMHDGSQGAARKSDDELGWRASHARMQHRHAHAAPDPAAVRVRCLNAARSLLPALRARGRHREALLLAWIWLRSRPESRRAWGAWTSALLRHAAHPGEGMTASASTSINAPAS